MIVGITGHRNIQDNREQIKSILEIITSGVSNWGAISPLAAGADQQFAEVALGLGGQLTVPLPFLRDEYLRDFNQEEVKNFIDLESSATHIFEVLTNKPQTQDERNQGYLNCGQYVVKNCDILIAVWDGKESRGPGGTAEIVDYANKIGVPVIVIYPDAKEVTIAVMHHYRSGNEVQFEELRTLQMPELEEAFNFWNGEANKWQAIYKKGWARTIFLGVFVALIFTSSLLFKMSPIVKFLCALSEISFLLLAFYSVKIINRSKPHFRYLISRFIAEQIRYFTVCLKGNAKVGDIDYTPTHKFSHESISENVDNGQMAFVEMMSLLELLKIRLNYSVNISVIDKSPLEELISGQMKYHRKRNKSTKEKSHRHHLKVNVTSVLFVLGVISFLIIATTGILSIKLPTFLKTGLNMVKVIGGVLAPALYAGLEALSYGQEWGKASEDSKLMAVWFDKELSALKHIQDRNYQQQVQKFYDEVYVILTTDQLQWGSVLGERGAPASIY